MDFPLFFLLLLVFFTFFTVKCLPYLQFMLVCDIWNEYNFNFIHIALPLSQNVYLKAHLYLNLLIILIIS